MAVTNPVKTSTIEDFIDLAENQEIDYNKLALFTKDVTNGAFIYSFENVLSTYMEELQALSQVYELTPQEKYKYRYNPYRMSNDLYNTTQLYWIILYLNDTCNAKDFDLKSGTIKLIPGTSLKKLIEMIVDAESMRIKLNREYMEEEGADVQ